MILYFSGTGNSRYVAKRIGKEIGDEAIDLFEKIKKRDFSEMSSERAWTIVAPTYAWRIPRIVQNWLDKTDFTGNRDVYFVMTCGGSIGNAVKYLEKFCSEKKLNFCGCIGITMPENYIALFSAPTKEEAVKIIQSAEPVIDQAARLIQEEEKFPEPDVSLCDRINSGIVNCLFYPMFVHAKKFFADDLCVVCHLCARLCPLGNINLENGKPVWGNNCTHCMACISHCPERAIEYGRHTKGLTRYVCNKNLEDNVNK